MFFCYNQSYSYNGNLVAFSSWIYRNKLSYNLQYITCSNKPTLWKTTLQSIHTENMLLSNLTYAFYRYRQSRFNARRIRKRVVFKHGDCNVEVANVAKRRRKYLQDIFTTLVDAQWRWTLLVFAMNFLLSWLGFAIVWWLIVFSHGDLLPEHQVSVLCSFSFIMMDIPD